MKTTIHQRVMVAEYESIYLKLRDTYDLPFLPAKGMTLDVPGLDGEITVDALHYDVATGELEIWLKKDDSFWRMPASEFWKECFTRFEEGWVTAGSLGWPLLKRRPGFSPEEVDRIYQSWKKGVEPARPYAEFRKELGLED